MSEGRTSEFSRRRKANFRKGVEIGIEEGRRREREALAIQLAPIGYITSDAAALLMFGLPCQTVHPCAEHDYTVPVYLGPMVQGTNAQAPAVASMAHNGECFIAASAPIETPPPREWNVFERPSQSAAPTLIGIDLGSPEGDSSVYFTIHKDGRLELITAEDFATIVTKGPANE